MIERERAEGPPQFGRALGCEEFDGEGSVPYGDAPCMVAVLMGEYQRPDVVRSQPAGLHPRKNLATRKPVIDHDEAAGARDDGAVAF